MSAEKKASRKKEKEIATIEKKVEENIEKAEEIEDKKEHPTPKQIAYENKTLIIMLIVIALLVGVFVFILILSNSSKNFTVDNVAYTVIQQGQITLYDTKIPLVINGTNVDYNIYLRNDPRVLKQEVPFNGSMYIRQNMVINASNTLKCNGDGVIAVANIVNTYQSALGINVMQDANASCDSQARYVYVNIQPSNETSVQEVSPACYQINVANCKILAATERFLTETFTTIQPYFNSTN